MTLLWQGEMFFSYGSIYVAGNGEVLALLTTVEHMNQGFTRHDAFVNFSALLEFGRAQLSVHEGPFSMDEVFDRVIAVPFAVGGDVWVMGPEESADARVVRPSRGDHRLVCAQRVVEDEERIALYFEPVSGRVPTQVLVADEGLIVPEVFMEDAVVLARG